MRSIRNGIAIVLIVFGLTACGTNEPAVGSGSFEHAQMKAAAAMPAAKEKLMPAPSPAAPKPVTIKHEYRTASFKPRAPKPTASGVPPENDPASQIQRIDSYLASLKTAAYTFNPPSPIRVAEPVTVHLWLDPQATAAELAEELRKAIPRDADRVESDETQWSPKMRATLSGDDFDVKAIDPEEQLVGSTQRTTWSWDITPRHAGEKLALHLRLIAVLPSESEASRTITTLDREINVEVTWWWLFDHYFEKYWKWLLGGLGTAMASVIAWWWKNRKESAKNS